MQGLSFDVLITVLVLGFMVLIHEFGHFAVAKLLGVRVEQFAIGFGARLVGFRRGETDYRINLLPFGGYVKMAGENPLEAQTGDPGEFTAHPRWHRFLIGIAGPTMNILLAVVLMTGVFMVHYVHEAFKDEPAEVGYVLPNSPAAKAGIQEGDRIVRAGNQNNPSWEQVIFQIALSARQPLGLAIQRGQEILDIILTPGNGEDVEGGDVGAGLVPRRPVEVAPFQGQDLSLPAARAGIRPGDVLTAVNGKPLGSIESLIAFLEQNQTKPVQVSLLRNGNPLTLQVTPVKTNGGQGMPPYRLGFTATEPTHVTRLSFPQALAMSVQTNKKYSKVILELLERLVQRRASVRQLVGPIGIGAATGQAARQGILPLLQLSALLSLNLGLFNLLPIPILDGGLILLLGIEALMRHDISQPIKERIYQLAFVFLLLLGAIAIYNDLLRTVPGLAGKLP